MSGQMAIDFDVKVLGVMVDTKNSSYTDSAVSKGHWRPSVGSSQCLCGGCGEGFNSVSAFVAHQRTADDGSAICLDPAKITDRNGDPKPMVRNARGLWVTALSERDWS